MPLALGRRLTPKFFGISDMPLRLWNRKKPELREYKTVTHNSGVAAESQNAGWPNRRPAFFLVTRTAAPWERTRPACGRSRLGFANFREACFGETPKPTRETRALPRNGGKGIRTPDFQLAKLALYQLSYAPDFRTEDCRWRMADCNEWIGRSAGDAEPTSLLSARRG